MYQAVELLSILVSRVGTRLSCGLGTKTVQSSQTWVLKIEAFGSQVWCLRPLILALAEQLYHELEGSLVYLTCSSFTW